MTIDGHGSAWFRPMRDTFAVRESTAGDAAKLYRVNKTQPTLGVSNESSDTRSNS
jgi:hypothetical protein